MIKVGTGGWRAIIGDDFTRENICLLAKAMADKICLLYTSDAADEL